MEARDDKGREREKKQTYERLEMLSRQQHCSSAGKQDTIEEVRHHWVILHTQRKTTHCCYEARWNHTVTKHVGITKGVL